MSEKLELKCVICGNTEVEPDVDDYVFHMIDGGRISVYCGDCDEVTTVVTYKVTLNTVEKLKEYETVQVYCEHCKHHHTKSILIED